MKKIVGIIIGLVVLGVVAVLGRNYYENTYVGQDFYVLVPQNQDVTIEEWQGGSYTIQGRRYALEGFNEAGESQLLEFEITDSADTAITEDQLLQPGQYLRVSASPSRVLNWQRISRDQVPAEALAHLE